MGLHLLCPGAILVCVTTEERVSRLEGAYEQVDERLGEIQAEAARTNERIDGLGDSVNRRFDALGESINRRFDAQNRMILAGLGLVLAAVVGLSFI